MSFRTKQDEESLKQKFSDFGVLQPLVKQNQATLVLEEKKLDLKEVGKKLLSNLLIFVGIFLTFESSLVIFQVFVANLADISQPMSIFFIFFIGLLLTILGSGRFGKKNDLLLHFSVPLTGFMFGFLFTLAPANLHGRLFGWISLFFYVLILFGFYCCSEFLESKETELK